MFMLKYIKNAGFFIICLFLVYSIARSITSYQKKIQFFQEYKNDFNMELEKNKKLKSELGKRQDYNVVERDIRERLNMVKPGEVALIVPRLTPSPTPTPEIKPPPFQQWINLFLR